MGDKQGWLFGWNPGHIDITFFVGLPAEQGVFALLPKCMTRSVRLPGKPIDAAPTPPRTTPAPLNMLFYLWSRGIPQ